ncbi:MAG: DUF4159 domain-containing protein [Phycisphaerae bacterium]|jgi:hypothetical protein|nr:DUF4159 domain-containing protein [Phycisphaerae bacterium]
MGRTQLTLVCLGVFLVISGGCHKHPQIATTTRPTTQPTKAPKRVEFSDAAVKRAIDKGVKFLWSRQQADGSWPGYGKPGPTVYYQTGPGAMAIYALLESGISPQEPKMIKALAWLENTPENMTYCLGMRCCAWEAANRTTNNKYKEILKSDLRRLITSTTDGSFHYDTGGSPKRNGDNSTSQFGMLAMQAASRNDIPIRSSTWRKCMNHWMRTQSKDGGWSYLRGTNNKPTMTAAGIASMYISLDNLYAQTFVKKPARAKDFPVLMSIQNGVTRLDKTFRNWGGRFSDYYLYGISRVGIATGFKRFNGIDWYKSGAVHLLKTQKPDGAWGEVYSTAFSMLFLMNARRPAIFSKLKYDGDWNNRPRDLATLSRWMSQMYCNLFRWQVANIKIPVRGWQDAPILLITGSEAPLFKKADVDKLRKFVLQGGTILSTTEFDGKEFSEAMRKVYKRMFPDYALKMLAKTHELYSHNVSYDLPQEDLKFEVMSNGVRPLVIHTDTDLTAHWQGGVYTEKSSPHFKAATNIARYMGGSLMNLRNRGVSHWPEKKNIATTRTIRIARLRHGGNWNPEPLAFEALAMNMKNRAGIKLVVAPPINIVQLPKSGVKFAMMTGTEAVKFSDAEKAAIKSFVEGGGTVLIDVAGGNGRLYGGVKPFARSIRGTLKEIYPGRRNGARRLASSSPLYDIDGNKIKTVRFRRHTQLNISERYPQIKAIMVDGRPGILLSELDLTAGLVGYRSLTVDGYTPDSAFKIVRNIILYANGEPLSR